MTPTRFRRAFRRGIAFDVTPAGLIAIVTEEGVHRAPYALAPHTGAQRPMIDVDHETAAVLERFGFDEAVFEALRARVAAGELSIESNLVQGSIEAPHPDEVTPLQAPGDADTTMREAPGSTRSVAATSHRSCSRVGWPLVLEASSRPYSRRSTAEASSRRSCVQTATLERTLGVAILIALMTSFATDEAIREHVRRRRLGSPLVFNQFVSLRLDPSGELFVDAADRASLYAPGHG